MRKILYVTIFTLIFGIIAGVPQTAHAQATPAKQQLIEKFRTNSKTDHKAAYETAKEFIREFPDDTGDDAQYMRKWVAAYEKVEQDNGNKTNVSKPEPGPADSTSPAKEPTLTETISWIRKVLDNEVVTSVFEGYADSTESQKVTNYDDCNLSVERFSGERRKKSGDGQDLFSKVSIDLRKTGASPVFESSKSFSPTYYSIVFSPEGVKGSTTMTERSTPPFGKPQETEVQAIDFSTLSFDFSTKEMAERFKKAADHAIKLCKQTKTNDPF